MVTDPEGYLYIAGTSTSADVPILNGAQPEMGNALVLRSPDYGVTWAKASRPPDPIITVIKADPTSAQTVFTGGPNGIQKSTDRGANLAHRIRQRTHGRAIGEEHRH